MRFSSKPMLNLKIKKKKRKSNKIAFSTTRLTQTKRLYNQNFEQRS